MTNEPKHPPADMAGLDGLIEVTQADRDAAASGYFAWCSNNRVIPDRMKSGNADNHSMVQAFARHRATQLQALAARVQMLEGENERLREALLKYHDLIEHQYCGSREAMNALQEADLFATAALKGTER